MRITIELEQADVERFLHARARSRRLALQMDESDIVAAAKHALNTLPIGSAPLYVRKRIGEVQRLIMIVEDEDWMLPEPERSEVLETLVYFSDPDDLIPDEIETIGLLDDAIMLELLARRLRHVLKAYSDFCEFRTRLGTEAAQPEAHNARAGKLARRRDELRTRMRRRQARMEGEDVTISATP
jgi:hypothetical protein